MRAEGLMGEPAPYLLLLLLLGYCLAVIDGELRCYCNESGCVSTGYMCKSAAGQCYTAVEVHGEKTRATHGCLDSVPLENRGLCGRDADRGGDAGGRGQGSQGDRGRERERTEVIRSGTAAEPGLGGVLICCAEDMCNYYGENEITLSRNITGSKGGIGDRSGVIYSRNDERHDDDRDLWFKAAVIAVPIAGGFILVLLVLLAVRMLRTDTQRHRRLIQIRRERSLTKAQLYVTDHFSDVSTKSDVGKTCSLFPPKSHVGGGGEGGGGGGVGLGVKVGLGGGKPVCRDVNISVDREGRVYEKVCDVSVHRHSQLPSVVKWGNPNKADLATVV